MDVDKFYKKQLENTLLNQNMFYGGDDLKVLFELMQGYHKDIQHKMFIVDQSSGETEEWYGTFYCCPKCDSQQIKGKVNFCDECGIPLQFSN